VVKGKVEPPVAEIWLLSDRCQHLGYVEEAIDLEALRQHHSNALEIQSGQPEKVYT
jgi:hypothetical protein